MSSLPGIRRRLEFPLALRADTSHSASLGLFRDRFFFDGACQTQGGSFGSAAAVCGLLCVGLLDPSDRSHKEQHYEPDKQ